jgi:hypothetical protein
MIILIYLKIEKFLFNLNLTMKNSLKKIRIKEIIKNFFRKIGIKILFEKNIKKEITYYDEEPEKKIILN